MQWRRSTEPGQFRLQRRTGQRTGGQDPVLRRGVAGKTGHFAPLDPDQRFGRDQLGDPGRENLAVHRQSRTRRHGAFTCGAQQPTAETVQLLLQQAGRCRHVRALEGVAADDLGQAVTAMDSGGALRPHLVEYNPVTEASQLQGGFAPGESTTHNPQQGLLIVHLSPYPRRRSARLRVRRPPPSMLASRPS